MDAAIRVEGLVKRFGSFTVVNGISFEVKNGENFGILGPNGAGKTTTLEIIEGLQKPTSGRVNVLGFDILRDPREIKARIGVQLQASSYFDYLSLREILALLGAFYPKRLSPDELLERVGLADKAASRVRHLSGGQKQRFSMAASLINDPQLVILDEPTTGLDPQARRNLWGLMKEIGQRGVTVVLTTHYMEEAAALCDRIAIMDQGRLLALDTPQNLVNTLGAAYTVKLVVDEPLTEAQLASLDGGLHPVQCLADNSYQLRLSNTPKALDFILDEIVHKDIRIQHLEITPVTLEDVYLKLTGSELRE